MVVSARNPVHSVLFLILAFFNAAGLFVLIGAEFLAMILVIVYVGAVAVLFLFVVMMLDINFVRCAQGFLQYLPIGGLVGLVCSPSWSWSGHPLPGDACAASAVPPACSRRSDQHAGARPLLYTRYFYLFQAAGLILLVAMIGAIVLTLRQREGVRRQKIGDQLYRTAPRRSSSSRSSRGGR
jgi:NADH-quinone oxidoreductase subunit J